MNFDRVKGFFGNFVSNKEASQREFHNEMANEMKEKMKTPNGQEVQNFGEEAMYVDHYSGTYYALITKYKKKYHLVSEDQAQYYFEALFLLFIQTVFCIAILTSNEFNIHVVTRYKPFYYLSLCLYFTSMILHFGSIYTIRNGILMTKYVIYHSEEFDHPRSAFLLGVMVTLVNIFCEMTNLLYSLTQSSVTGVISKFVAFKILI